ncbi:MAG: helix-turn-helix domain-containing protein [Pseudomonadales bacterium]
MSREPDPDVRSRILDAALALLGEAGTARLTQTAVAREAGVRQSHLTYYFPTRAELLKATAVHSIEAMLSTLGARAADGELTLDMLTRIADTMVGDKRRPRILLGLITTSEEDRAIKGFLRDFVARVRAGLAMIAQQLGHDVAADRVALCHTLIVGAAVLNVARDDAASRRESADMVRFAVETLLLDGQGND